MNPKPGTHQSRTDSVELNDITLNDLTAFQQADRVLTGKSISRGGPGIKEKDPFSYMINGLVRVPVNNHVHVVKFIPDTVFQPF